MNLRRIVKQRITEAGGLRRLARLLKVDPSYLCRVANGTQQAGPEMLAALGLERTTGYRRADGR